MRFRTINRWYARGRRYFWLPCPLCGQMFGGHEWRDYEGLSSIIRHPERGPEFGKGICKDCTLDGKGDN